MPDWKLSAAPHRLLYGPMGRRMWKRSHSNACCELIIETLRIFKYSKQTKIYYYYYHYYYYYYYYYYY